MSARSSALVRTAAGLGVLGAVLWQTGLGPFRAGLAALDVAVLALGVAIAVPTTVACAWRWQLVARGLGLDLRLGRAVAACYRAQFLNTTLPGGVLGDAHRGFRHGREEGSTGRGLRAVVWERTAGQVVQLAVLLLALALLPSPVADRGGFGMAVLLVLLALPAAGLLGLRFARRHHSSRRGRLLAAMADDVRHGLLTRQSWPGVLAASVLALTGHVATYLLAARAVGVAAPAAQLVPLALLVMVAAALPVNVAGWGPREGAAGWTFAAAGLDAQQGVAAAVAFGAVVLVANLPGALVLALASRRPAVPAAVGAGDG